MRTDNELNLKQKVVYVFLLSLICTLPIFLFLKGDADKSAAQESIKAAAENGRKAISAMMADHPQNKKGKKKMVQIAVGTTKQADVYAAQPTECVSFASRTWSVSKVGSGIIAEDASPGEWNVTPEGIVTVPPDAAIGSYQAGYIEDPGSCTLSEPGDGRLVHTYEFEVVCLKVTLRSYTRSLP